MATAIGPPEVKIAIRSPRPPADKNDIRPESTREQNSDQGSTPRGQIKPHAHLVMTASNNF